MAPVALPIRLFKTVRHWEAWLERHGGTSAGVRMRIAKKAGTLTSVTYQEALDVALCFGWIDGLKQPLDRHSWLQRFTPRGPRSVWSKINRAKALALIKVGRMRDAGLAAIRRAKENGQWVSAYDSYRTAKPPADLLRALRARPRAYATFKTLSARHRFGVIYRTMTARKPETRAKRIRDLVARLSKGQEPFS
ncbi:MAG TPA: YdeI/OmpD-associated family protein [Gemmatimonadales bacterium]|nr:YdeI/OmpD-associated family protein [Gemmatimonadales bacterium]